MLVTTYNFQGLCHSLTCHTNDQINHALQGMSLLYFLTAVKASW